MQDRLIVWYSLDIFLINAVVINNWSDRQKTSEAVSFEVVGVTPCDRKLANCFVY